MWTRSFSMNVRIIYFTVKGVKSCDGMGPSPPIQARWLMISAATSVGILASQAVRSASQDVRCSGAAQQAAGQSKDESRHATGSEVVIDGAVSA